MADGEVKINTKLDTSGVDKGLKDLNKKLDDAGKSIDNAGKKSKTLNNNRIGTKPFDSNSNSDRQFFRQTLSP